MKNYDLSDYVEYVSQNEHTGVLKVKDTEDTKMALIANGFWGNETMFRITVVNDNVAFEAFTSDNAYPKYINNDLKKSALSLTLLMKKAESDKAVEPKPGTPKAKRAYHHHKK